MHKKEYNKVVIDGRVFHRTFCGVIRYEKEILLELDKIVEHGKYELLLLPQDADKIYLNHINKVYLDTGGDNDRKSRKRWRREVRRYLKQSKGLYVHMANGRSIGFDSITTIHDIYGFFDVLAISKMSIFRRRARIVWNVLFAQKIVTVSHYTKQVMLGKLPLKESKIEVIGNGWQHIKVIQSDDKVLERCRLIDKQYYLYIGRLVKNKNIKWIFEVADRNLDSLFVISGDLDNEPFDFYKGKHGNIIYTGYVTDSEMKSLYQHCKAFLFPSIMEGFGIPPMEALYNGVPIIIANTSSLPEIYGKSAHYIDPYRYDYDLDEILQEPVESADVVLDKYSWEKSAREWKELIESYVR